MLPASIVWVRDQGAPGCTGLQLYGYLVPFLTLSVVVRNTIPGSDKLCILARDLVQQLLYLHKTAPCCHALQLSGAAAQLRQVWCSDEEHDGC